MKPQSRMQFGQIAIASKHLSERCQEISRGIRAKTALVRSQKNDLLIHVEGTADSDKIMFALLRRHRSEKSKLRTLFKMGWKKLVTKQEKEFDNYFERQAD